MRVQLAMFKNRYKVNTTADAVHALQEMPPEVRGLFDQVETLVRLLMVVPISSAEAEQSFSGLRRLKTWLRSTMMQKRLNGIAVCHIHQERLVFGSFSESAKTVNLFGFLFIHVKYAVVYTSECMFK